MDSGDAERKLDGMSDGAGLSEFIGRCAVACAKYEEEHGRRVTGQVRDGSRSVFKM